MKHSLSLHLFYLFTLVALGSCSVAELRKDSPPQEEAPSETIGGKWIEGGSISSEGSSRAPASVNSKKDSSETLYSNQLKYPKAQTNVDSANEQPARVTRNDFRDNSTSDGSLWTSDGQTNYFLTKNNVFSVGDILTLKTDETFVSDVVSEIKKTLDTKEKEKEIEDAKAIQLANYKKENADREIAQSKKESKGIFEKDEDEETLERFTVDWNKVDISKKVSYKSGDPIMVEIIQRYPNGHYKIKGYKKVPYLNSVKLIAVEGVAKAADISESQEIASNKLYEYRLNSIQ